VSWHFSKAIAALNPVQACTLCSFVNVTLEQHKALLFLGGVGTGAALKPEDFARAMKLCKFASSALQYEDSKTAIDNLTKALNLLTTGQE